MAPTKEEEHKLKEFNDESPFKLGPAEKFLKAVLEIPFAFERVDALLYIDNFDSEIEYLKGCFETLQVSNMHKFMLGFNSMFVIFASNNIMGATVVPLLFMRSASFS